MDANPTGTIFTLLTGVHRSEAIEHVIPKNGNVFIGEPGAVMSGARVLSNFHGEGPYWVAADQTQQGPVGGTCTPGYGGCIFSEDLFIDGVPLWRVVSLGEVAVGQWFFDYAANKIYLQDDPAGRLVETSVGRHAFAGFSQDVTIRGLTIEKYANPAQSGAINGPGGVNWVIDTNLVQLNHGAGIVFGDGAQILQNRVLRNGQIGLKTPAANNVIVEGNGIAFNNYAGYSSGWEAGGTKFARTNGLVLRGNNVHDNKGPGLWTDINNINCLIEGNTVRDNEGMGIFHEISYAAIIRDNIVERNSRGWSPWLYGAQIMLSSSRDTEIYGNTVVVAADGGNGITLIQQNRGTGTHGPWVTTGNYVHHNDITHLGDQGLNGGAADWEQAAFLAGGNRFDFNTYHVLDVNGQRWHWQGLKNWTGFNVAGQETNGQVL